MTTVTREFVREMAIKLLDDEEGINESGYDSLRQLLKCYHCEDIINCVDATDGRFYLKTGARQELTKG